MENIGNFALGVQERITDILDCMKVSHDLAIIGGFIGEKEAVSISGTVKGYPLVEKVFTRRARQSAEAFQQEVFAWCFDILDMAANL